MFFIFYFCSSPLVRAGQVALGVLGQVALLEKMPFRLFSPMF